MTKLDKKLLELGYKNFHSGAYNFWSKGRMVIKTFCEKIVDYYTITLGLDIEDYQEVFNQLQQDLEVLKGVESNN